MSISTLTRSTRRTWRERRRTVEKMENPADTPRELNGTRKIIKRTRGEPIRIRKEHGEHLADTMRTEEHSEDRNRNQEESERTHRVPTVKT